MSITTQTNRAFIEAEQYSDFILTNLEDGLLPTIYYRDVTDFGKGEVLHIKSIGEAQIQEVEEDSPLVYTAIETGEVQLRITEYTGDAWYVTDKFRQDASQVDTLLAERGKTATRAIQEHFESKALQTLNDGQVQNDPNVINGQAHRLAASGPNDTISVADLVKMKLAFDKADVPYAGRVAIVDPVVGASLSLNFQGTYAVDSNPKMQGILENGFDRDHQYFMNLCGWDIISSNRLPRVDGDLGVAGPAVANIFLSVADDNTKALMTAWRQQVRVEGERNKDKQRDEFVATARYGFGIQRVDSLGVIVSSSVNVE